MKLIVFFYNGFILTEYNSEHNLDSAQEEFVLKLSKYECEYDGDGNVCSDCADRELIDVDL